MKNYTSPFIKNFSNHRSLAIWIFLLYFLLFAYLLFFPYSYGIGKVSPSLVTSQGDINFYSYFGAMSPKEYLDYIYIFWAGNDSNKFYPGPLFPVLIYLFEYLTSPIYLSILFAIIGMIFQYMVCSWMLVKHHIPLPAVFIYSLNPYVLLYSFIPSPDILLAFISFLIFTSLLDCSNNKLNLKLVVVLSALAASAHPIGVMLPLIFMFYVFRSIENAILIKSFALFTSFFWVIFYLPYLKAMIDSITITGDAAMSFGEFWSYYQSLLVLGADFLNNASIQNLLEKFSRIYGFQDSQTGNLFHYLYRIGFGLIMLGGSLILLLRGEANHKVFALLLIMPTILTYPSTRYIMPIMPILYIYFFTFFKKLKDT